MWILRQPIPLLHFDLRDGSNHSQVNQGTMKLDQSEYQIKTIQRIPAIAGATAYGQINNV